METLKTKNLTIPARQKVRDKRAFFEFCGDQFVISIKTGGAFSALVTFESTSEEHKKTVDAAIKGGVSRYYSGKATTFKEVLESLSQVSTYRISIIRKGDNSALPSMEKI